MSTEISIPKTHEEIMSISKVFAESGMFGDQKEVAKAYVKVQAGLEMGLKPFQAMSGIHIISGKPTVGAGLMAAMVRGSGKYDYRVLQQTDKICELEFFQLSAGGKESLGKVSFTIAQATKAGTKNLDKFPENMLFARAMSNGVKFHTPDIFGGPVYTPEEMRDLPQEPTQDAQFEVIQPEAPKKASPAQPAGTAKAEPAPQTEQTAEEVSPVEYYTGEVAKCQTQEQLEYLYRANVDEIGGDTEVIALFTARKVELEAAAAGKEEVLNG